MRYSFLMPNNSKVKRTEILEWLKGGGLLAITIVGLLLYFFLSLPATVFYARLGTTPGEIGITYASLLSGSTVEILAILILLTHLLACLVYHCFYKLFCTRFRRYYPAYLNPVSRKPSWAITDAEFEDQVKFWRRIYGFIPENTDVFPRIAQKRPRSFDEVEKRQRCLRELRMIGVRTAEQSAELELMESQREHRVFDLFESSLLLTKYWIQRKGRLLATVFVVLIIVVLLPALAFAQAGSS